MKQNTRMFNAVHEPAITSKAIAEKMHINHAELMCELQKLRKTLPGTLRDTLELRTTENPQNSYYLCAESICTGLAA